MEKNIFEVASRKKFRFETTKGVLSTEDLWEIPMTGKVSLNEVAKCISREIKDSIEEDFVNIETRKNLESEEKLELVKYIIEVRKNESLKKVEDKKKEEEKEFYKKLLREKEIEEKKNMSKEELIRLIES